MAIQQNTALFSIVGTYYGGDGRTTFGLPNLGGIAAMGQGQGLGLTPRVIGETGGSSTVSLLVTEIPAHIHAASAALGGAASTMVTSPAGANWSNSTAGTALYAAAPIDTPMSPLSLSPSGGSQPHNNMQPFLAINYIIATEGVFPTRS